MINIQHTYELLTLYGESFPFNSIDESSIAQLNSNLKGELSPLLLKIYRTIGKGYYFMTTPFFEFDLDLSMTLRLQAKLAQQKIVEYLPTYRELIIGTAEEEHFPTEPVVFFVSDFSDEDPIVHCLSTADNRILDKRFLSQILPELRGYPDCSKVPQGVFDYYWYCQHFSVPPDHNAAQLSIAIMDWVLAGREGMDEKFRNHSPEGQETAVESSSVFSSLKYVL